MLKYGSLLLVPFLFLSGCTTQVQSNPARTAMEELLISTAAENAASQLAVTIPDDKAVFLDNTNFEGTDSKNAVAAIRTSFLKKGMRLADDKKSADIVIETRSGALSIDQNTFLIGIPQFNVPVPFASTPLTFPEIALYSSNEQKGVAKFAVTGMDAKKGTLIGAQDAQFGFSHNTKKTVMIFFSWTDTDVLPNEDAKSDAANHKIEPAPSQTQSAPNNWGLIERK